MKQRGAIAILGGAGMMGQAIVKGLVRKRLYPPGNITVTAKHQSTLVRVETEGVRKTLSNKSAARKADIIILCVHPNQAEPLLRELAPDLKPEQLLITVVTGISIDAIFKAAGEGPAVVRAAPNIAAIVGASMTAVCAGPRATRSQMQIATRLFRSIGEVTRVDEGHLNACTGLAGCGAAFAFKVIESLAEGGIKVGLPREVARQMAAQVLLGAGQLVLKTGQHPAYLKDAVASPGGCTIDGLAELEGRGLPIALISAVETSTRKAGLLFDNDKETTP